MDRLVQQFNLTAKTGEQKITEYGGYSTEPHRRISYNMFNFLDIRLNEEETICLFLWFLMTPFQHLTYKFYALE